MSTKSEKNYECCLFGVPPRTEEERELARKWKNGELKMCVVDRPSKFVPELRWQDEIIVATKQEPHEGDVVAVPLQGWPLFCEIALYCEEIRELIADGEINMLGVVVEYRHDPFTATRDELKFRKFVRDNQPELETAAG